MDIKLLVDEPVVPERDLSPAAVAPRVRRRRRPRVNTVLEQLNMLLAQREAAWERRFAGHIVPDDIDPESIDFISDVSIDNAHYFYSSMQEGLLSTMTGEYLGEVPMDASGNIDFNMITEVNDDDQELYRDTWESIGAENWLLPIVPITDDISSVIDFGFDGFIHGTTSHFIAA